MSQQGITVNLYCEIYALELPLVDTALKIAFYASLLKLCEVVLVQSVHSWTPYKLQEKSFFFFFLTMHFLLVPQTSHKNFGDPRGILVYYHAYPWENPCGGLFSLAICVRFSPCEVLVDWTICQTIRYSCCASLSRQPP